MKSKRAGGTAPWARELRVWAILWAALVVGIFACLAGREVRSGAFLIGDCPSYASAGWAAVGIVPGIAAWMLVNLALFGGPAVTGYDRTLVLQDGVAQTISHKGFFDLPLLDGMSGQLLDPRAGLLTISPILLLAIPGFVIFLRRHPWDAALFLGIAEFLFLLFSTYRWWATSHYGNRFLMLPMVLAAVPLAFTLQAVMVWIRAVGRQRAEAASESR